MSDEKNTTGTTSTEPPEVDLGTELTVEAVKANWRRYPRTAYGRVAATMVTMVNHGYRLKGVRYYKFVADYYELIENVSWDFWSYEAHWGTGIPSLVHQLESIGLVKEFDTEE